MLINYPALAAELHAAADRIAKLGEQNIAPPAHASIYLTFGYGTSRPAAEIDKSVQAVNAIAEAFGLTAVTKFEGRGANRRGEHRAENGFSTALHITVRTSVPVPPTRSQKLADLQRENDELRARLASTGGQA